MSTGWDGYYDDRGTVDGHTPTYHTPPGWYPDATSGPGVERWWDGNAWTIHQRTPLSRWGRSDDQVQTVKVKPQKVIDRGLSPAAHTFWLVTTIATFGVGGFGWFLHWLFRQIVPRHVRTIR